MPPRPAVTGVFQQTLHWAIGGDLTAIVRRFYLYAGAVSPADATTLATAVNTAQAAQLRSVTTSANTFLGTTITDLGSSSGAEVFVSTSSAGTRAGSALPGSACAVEQAHIARRYRGGHPRTYWPFGTGNDNSSAQLWIPASLTAFATARAAFDTAWKASVPAGIGAVTDVSVSWYSGFTNVTLPSGRATSKPTYRATPVVDGILSRSFRSTIGSQRRRLSPAS